MPHRISAAKILDFDTESRPLSFWYADRPSSEITAIAWSWVGESKTRCLVLGKEDGRNDRYSTHEWVGEMLIEFLAVYHEADIVTGHYIRKHDLPIINGALIENGLPTLPPKLTSDTKLDLSKRADLPVSQEALSAYLEIPAPKVHMTQHDWREANRLGYGGLEKTYKRVVGDVRQHKSMRAELLARDLLHAPKVWAP